MIRPSARTRRMLTVSALALATATPSLAPAAVFSWNGGTDLFNNPAAWTPNNVPGSGDDAQIYAASSNVEIIGFGQNVGTLELGQAANSGEQLTLNNGSLTVYGNSVTNNGLISLAAGAALYSGSGTTTYSGTGVISLDNSAGQVILGDGNGESFGANQTIQGAGNIGDNGTVITNNGLISGNVNNATAGQTLDIDPNGGSGGLSGGGVGTGANAGLYNTGTIQATGGGFVNLYTGYYENSSSGVIRANTGSTVQLNDDTRIVNGSLTTVGSGVIQMTGGTERLQGVTLTTGSNLSLNSNTLLLETGITNNGAIAMANNAYLTAETASATISGTGTISLVNSVLGNGNALVLGAGQTVTGYGNVGNNGTLITNNGVISSNVSGHNLIVDPVGGSGGEAPNGVGTNGAAGLYNTGTIQATGGGLLNLYTGYYENSSTGVIRANTGSTVQLDDDTRIVNGSLTTVGSGVIQMTGGTERLQGVTLTTGSNLSLNNNTILLETGITNNGAIALANNAYLTAETASATISGTGTISLASSVLGNGNALVLGAGQTVTGYGDVGNNGTVITNNGVISGNVSGQTLIVDPSGGQGGITGGLGSGGAAGFLNAGTIQANGTNTALALYSGQYDNTNGVIRAINGGVVTLDDDTRIIGGSLTSDSTSSIQATGGTERLQGVTLTTGSNLSLNNDTILLETGITNNGTIALANSAYLTAETASATIGGTGAISLASSVLGNGNALVLGAGQTVTGYGDVGNNGTVITNNGVISGNASGKTLIVDPSGGQGGVTGGLGSGGAAGFLNAGTIQANGTNTALAIYSGQYDNTNGVIRAINGGVVTLDDDTRIIGGSLTSDSTSSIQATGGTERLQGVTLTTGSNLSLNSDTILLETRITNNGAIALANNAYMTAETPSATIGGTGTISLASSVLGNGNALVLGAGQTVTGYGNVGDNGTVITNNGVISGNVSGQTLIVDPTGGNGGLSGGGVGTGGNDGLYNTGTIQSASGGTTQLYSGLYENSAAGTLAALTGSTTNMNGDTSLYNLQAGGVLNMGNYTSSTTGAASVLNLQSNQANSIVTIGTSAPTTDTVVTLSGANSQINVYLFDQGPQTSIDASLAEVNTSGKLVIENGRTFDAGGNGGAFTNAGVVQLSAGTFGAASLANSGLITGNGSVTVAIANTGAVEAAGGVLATQAITGGAGVIRTLAGATLDLTAATAASTAGTLTNNGSLALGSQNLTVTSDYTNANFGSGNSFNRRANVTGSGDIYGVNYTEDLSGPALSGSTIDVGNVRTGGSSSTTLTITNNGTATNIIGAVQNTNAPSIAVSPQDFTAAHGGGSATVTLSYTGTTAGPLSGQSITVVNNFANIGPKTLAVEGNVYQIAVAGSQPSSLSLGAARVGDTAQSQTLTIANVAPNTPGYTESLTSTASTSSPFQVNGGASATASQVAAGSSTPLTVTLGTGTAGAFSNTVAISNTSIPVAGSGFTPLALAGQSVAVSGNVYAPAVATLSSNTVAFGPVREGTTGVTASLSLTNTASGALADSLVSSVGSAPSGVAVTTPGALAQGQMGTVGFALNTQTPGQVNGQATLDFTSHDSQLADLALPSQQVGVTATVTQIAQAMLTKDAGAGTFSQSGATYTLDLGTFVSGSGTQTATLGVTNAIPASTYAEFLNGGFMAAAATGYSFDGQTFTGLAGGSHTSGDVLDFDTDGLSSGRYTETLTFDGYSSYSGLANDDLAPITVDVTAEVTGGGPVSAAPEPSTWALMILGVGLVGASLRRGVSRIARRRVA